LSLGELRERLKKQTLCEVAAELLRKVSALPVSVERFEYWQPNNDPVTDALLRSLFIEANPLRSARRSSGLNVTEFARMLGISRQRLHVLERANGGEALLRACARAESCVVKEKI
jgi:DNA-binding XRE family transcriptional regulator